MCIRDSRAGIEAKRQSGLPLFVHIHATEYDRAGGTEGNPLVREIEYIGLHMACLLYTSDAADERSSVDLGGRRIIKKKDTTAPRSRRWRTSAHSSLWTHPERPRRAQ